MYNTKCALFRQLICKGYERILLPALGIDKSSGNVCCPTTKESVENFVEDVLGSSDLPTSASPGNPAANIVILDQHIDLKGQTVEMGTPSVRSLPEVVLGTDIAADLRLKNFPGLILIRSANSSAEDCKLYASTGVIDGVLGKAETHQDAARSICSAYFKKRKSASVEEHRSTKRGCFVEKTDY